MPSTTEQFDLIIIGSGPAGYIGAIRAAQLGLKTACIEKEKNLGGTCLNVGCIPSKALLESSEHFHQAKTKFAKHGILVDNLKLDLPAMMKRKDAVVRHSNNGVAYLFKKNKIESVPGLGSFIGVEGQNKIVEANNEGQKRRLSAPNVIIATGSAPAQLPFLPFDGKKVVSSTEALTLSEVPKHLVVIGGGVIGLELGSVWLRLGARVTVVEFQDRILPTVDGQTAAELYKSLQKQGMEFRLATKCLGATQSGKITLVQTEEIATGAKAQLEADVVLVATGRKPHTEGLGLEKVGLSTNKAGQIEIGDHFQTAVPGIFAIGDVVRGPMLAHKGEEEGVACAELIAGKAGHVNYGCIPNVIYTWPEIASVGPTEEELKAQGIAYNSGSFPFMANGRARSMEEVEGFVKVLADARTDRVLGVHIVGPRASDMIAEAVAVMEFAGSAEDIGMICHAHPTLSEAMKEAALGVGKRALNI